DKVVFVGSGTQSGFSGKRRDQFSGPFAGRGEALWPGVDFHATQFLNLIRNDWLRRPPPLLELGLIAFYGVAAGIGLALVRPVTAVAIAAAMALAVTVAACLLVWQTHVWLNWMVIVAVQIPIGLSWSVVQVAQKKT